MWRTLGKFGKTTRDACWHTELIDGGTQGSSSPNDPTPGAAGAAGSGEAKGQVVESAAAAGAAPQGEALDKVAGSESAAAAGATPKDEAAGGSTVPTKVARV